MAIPSAGLLQVRSPSPGNFRRHLRRLAVTAVAFERAGEDVFADVQCGGECMLQGDGQIPASELEGAHHVFQLTGMSLGETSVQSPWGRMSRAVYPSGLDVMLPVRVLSVDVRQSVRCCWRCRGGSSRGGYGRRLVRAWVQPLIEVQRGAEFLPSRVVSEAVDEGGGVATRAVLSSSASDW